MPRKVQPLVWKWDEENNHPVVPVRAERSRTGGWRLIAMTPCPHGQFVVHGGGTKDDPEPVMGESATTGVWGSHCSFFATYRLVLVDPLGIELTGGGSAGFEKLAALA